jgi:hypothetical protein
VRTGMGDRVVRRKRILILMVINPNKINQGIKRRRGNAEKSIFNGI